LDATRANVFNDRGWAHHAKKDFGMAIQDYDHALRLNPDYAFSLLRRGLAYHGKNDHTRAIQDYSRAIELSPNYSAAFNNRGNVYRDMRDYDRAIQDYDEAIRLNPAYTLAFNNRAIAYRSKRDYGRALADHEVAARLDPKGARHKSMGHTLFYLGRMGESAEAMARAIKVAPKDGYAMLWRYIAMAKQTGIDNASLELSEHAAKLTESLWPTPIIYYYVGKIDEKEIYAAAENPDSKKKSEKICEANFYLAEAKLLKGATNEAIPLLRAAEKECPSTFFESHGASTELKRLGY
jgi:lipoprotein NlpI